MTNRVGCHTKLKRTGVRVVPSVFTAIECLSLLSTREAAAPQCHHDKMTLPALAGRCTHVPQPFVVIGLLHL